VGQAVVLLLGIVASHSSTVEILLSEFCTQRRKGNHEEEILCALFNLAPLREIKMLNKVPSAEESRICGKDVK